MQVTGTVSVCDFCLECQRVCTTNLIPHVQNSTDYAIARKENYDSVGTNGCLETRRNFESGSAPCDHMYQAPVDFSGIFVIKNFVTGEEERALCDAIYGTGFVNSQSGRRKQDYGPKVNFKRKKLKFAAFTGLPSYSQFLYERMKEQKRLADFEPVELCNLEYCSDRGAHIDPHFDDSWLWGERLITLNLLSSSTLTFTSDKHPGVEVRVPLPRRSLIVVQGAARHQWKHSISRDDITGRRMAMTFRELSNEFRLGGSRERDGEELLKLALTFQGCAVEVP
ncbi:AlkB, alkylation repair homolog 4 [Elysia marginata]|uniref:AlkB, alkylation repair homolog 4 n=1 Tax=Elysia marginata TaxID=1093978 RepID=A0AAV4EAZ3_9GAST|nr:AlkB, alkylation repair homolog 4 [Elysia marginata]